MMRALRRALALALIFFLCAPPYARADDAIVQDVFAIQINGSAITNGAVILEKPAGVLFASESDLTAWGFNLRGRVPDFVFEGQPYFALASFTGLTTKVDVALQALSITAPGELFLVKVIDVGEDRGRMGSFDGTRGVFLDYSVGRERAVRNNLTTGLFTLGYTGLPGGGVLTSDFDYSAATGERSFLGRLGTTYRRDDLAHNATLRIGDSVTSAGRLGTPVAFLGIQRSTDFALDPSLLIFPSVSATGISQAQSTVDVYVNGVQTANVKVAPGPFTVSNLPVLDGQGDVTLVVKDVFGREHIVVTPFYYTRSLLTPGLSESSYEAGVLRKDFGSGLGSYGAGLISGTYRRGFSNHFTGEGHLEATSSAHLVDIAGDLLIQRLGVFHAAFGQSSSSGRSGIRTLLGYDYSKYRGVSMFVNGDFQSAEFASIGQTPIGADSFTTTAGLRKQFTHGRSVSLALVERHVVGSTPFGSASLGMSTPVAGGYLTFSMTRAFSGGGTGAAIQLSRQLGGRFSADTQTAVGQNRYTTVAFHEALPDSGLGSGFDLGLGSSNGGATVDAGSYQRTPYGSGRERIVATRGSDAAYALSWQGAVSLLDGHLHATDTINTSYGLVELPGYQNVRVYSDGRLVGRTNSRGEVFIPTLAPYISNEIEIDPRDLPIDVNVDNYVAHVKPYARNASVVRFKTHRSGGVLIHVVDGEGQPLPLGTQLTTAGGEEPWLVARGGTAYLRGIRHGVVAIDANTGGPVCRMTIVVPADTAGLPDLGAQVCRPDSKMANAPSPMAGPGPSVPRDQPATVPGSVADRTLEQGIERSEKRKDAFLIERKPKDAVVELFPKEHSTAVDRRAAGEFKRGLPVIGRVHAKRRYIGHVPGAHHTHDVGAPIQRRWFTVSLRSLSVGLAFRSPR